MNNDGGTFPSPTGAHRVGRLALDLVDESRRDPYSRRGHKRRLGVWVWYPASAAGGEARAAYLPGWWRLLGPIWGFRPSRVHVRAVPDAPVDETGGPYPLLVFSPSANPPHFYSALFEELASHGYVVAGIAHTYETIPVTVLPRGGIRLLNPKTLAGAFSVPGKRPFEVDLTERAALIRIKAADVRFVVGEVLRLSAHGLLLGGRLDAERVGAVGHSFGGAAAVEASNLDSRIKAAVSIDGGLWRTVSEITAATPVLQLFGEHEEFVVPCEEAVERKYYANVAYCREDRETTVGGWQALHDRAVPGYSVLARGAGHASFLDWPLLPLWRVAMARRGLGSTRGEVVWRVAGDYVLGFLAASFTDGTGGTLENAASDERVVVGPPRALFAADR